MAAKISKEQAQAIRVAIAEGQQTRKEAAEFWNVSLETIHRIVRGETHRAPGSRMGVRQAVSEEEVLAGAARLMALQEEIRQEGGGGGGGGGGGVQEAELTAPQKRFRKMMGQGEDKGNES